MKTGEITGGLGCGDLGQLYLGMETLTWGLAHLEFGSLSPSLGGGFDTGMCRNPSLCRPFYMQKNGNNGILEMLFPVLTPWADQLGRAEGLS